MTKSGVPKQQDVGKLAGVSRATVSQVLNNKAGFSVPAETRQRVLAAAQELGYVPNVSARNLRIQKTHTIAVVIQDIGNPFYPAFVRGVQDIAEQAGYDVISFNTDSSEVRERHFVNVLRQGRVDGVVGVFWHVKSSGLRDLTARGIPVALLGQLSQPVDDLIDQVYVDDQQAAHQAVRHLLARGHRQIAVIAGPDHLLQERVEGYLAAMREAGCGDRAVVLPAPDLTEEGGHQAAQELFAGPERPTAVFAVNDLLALGVVRASRERGLSIPGDLALIGFDDIPAARLITPPLTTVHQFQYGLGQRCARMLLERLGGSVTDQAGRKVEMPFELIIRESTVP